MPISILPSIASRLAELEAAPRPIEPHLLSVELDRLVTDPDKLTEDERLGCQAEIVGWRFMPMRGDDRGPWDSYFGPLGSGTTEDGKEVYFPDAREISREVIEHWWNRSEQASHPVLRARYADLALEIGRVWNRHHPSQPQFTFSRELAQRAVDAHLKAVADDLAESDHQAWTFLNRALDLALLVKDRERVGRAKLEAFAYCRKLHGAGESGYWWNLDNMFWDRKGAPLTEEERSELIGWLEEALEGHANIKDAQRFDPHQAQSAADRLSRWSEKLGAPERSISVIKKAGAAFEEIAAKSNALTAIAWLEDLSVRYRRANLMGDVARVDATIKARSEEAEQSMRRHEVRLEITKQEMDEWLNNLLGESLELSLGRIAVHLMTSEEQLRQFVEDSAANAPLQAHIQINIVGSSGFTRAKIGSVKDDMPGRLMNMAATLIGQQAPWVHMALQRAKEKWQLDSEKLFAWLTQSPLFPVGSHSLLRVDIDSWFAEDHLKAIHLLVPQAEAALREWLMLMGESPMRPDPESGGFEALGMGRVLHTESFRTRVNPTLRMHLRALYTDAKGLNVRNRIAHGLASPEVLDRGIANWVIHSLLAIRTYAHLK